MRDQCAGGDRDVAQHSLVDPHTQCDYSGGVGGGDPLPRGDDMGDRAYQSGLARVTLIWRLQP
jgi:hypothetical protein